MTFHPDYSIVLLLAHPRGDTDETKSVVPSLPATTTPGTMPPFRKNRILLCILVDLTAGPEHAIQRLFFNGRPVGVLERDADMVEAIVVGIVGGGGR